MFRRPALTITLALILTAILTLAFSPDARAAVQALLSFNGVTVTIDEETGKLVVSGNLDAVIEQTDNLVFIEGDNGSGAGVAIVGVAGEMVAVDEIVASTPDLALPEVPAGYTLDSKVLRMPDGTLMFTWANGTGQIITYRRSTNPPPAPIQFFEGSITASESDSAVTAPAIPLDPGIQPPAEGEITMASPVNGLTPPVAVYDWEADGYYHSLVTDDTALTMDDLRAMAP